MNWQEKGHVIVGFIEILVIIFGLFYLVHKFA